MMEALVPLAVEDLILSLVALILNQYLHHVLAVITIRESCRILELDPRLLVSLLHLELPVRILEKKHFCEKMPSGV